MGLLIPMATRSRCAQTPAGPYSVGITSVILSVVDTKGATAQATANVTVVNPGFTLAASLPSVSTTAGGTATEKVSFTPNPGINGAVTLACTNLPAKSTCSFAPSTIASGMAATSVVLTIATTASTAAAMPHSRIITAVWMPFTGVGLFGIALLIPGKRRRASATVMTLLVMGGLLFTMGCSDSRPAYNGTPKGTSTVTITGTSGNVTQTTKFTLTVN